MHHFTSNVQHTPIRSGHPQNKSIFKTQPCYPCFGFCKAVLGKNFMAFDFLFLSLPVTPFFRTGVLLTPLQCLP